MKFAEAFKQLRKDLKLNQTSMAKKLKVTQGAISKIESGQMKPSAEALIRAYKLTDHSFSSTPLFDRFFY